MKAIREMLIDFMCMVYEKDENTFSTQDILLFYTSFSFLLIMVAVASMAY